MCRFIFFCCFLLTNYPLLTQQFSAPEIRKAIPIAPAKSRSSNSAINDIRIETTSEVVPIDFLTVTPRNTSSSTDPQFAVAEGFYLRKEYALANKELQKFLQLTSPGDRDREQALFDLGETYRFLNQNLEAQATYQQLLKEASTGEVAASAWYRIGSYYAEKKDFEKADDAFSKAIQLTKNGTLQKAARYHQTLSHEALEEQKKGAMLFDTNSQKVEEKTVEAEHAMLSAHEDEKRGHLEKALTAYLSLSGESAPQIAAEALVKAGMITLQEQNRAQALSLFTKAADLKGGDNWSATGALQIMKLSYDSKEYQKILERAPQALASSNLEECSEALLLTVKAERQLGNFQKALERDNRLLKEFPASQSAHEAAFIRLLLLHSLKDPSLPSQLQDFILTTSDPHQKAEAGLLQGEIYFQKGEYAPAAKAYAMVKDSDLSPTLKADAAYKEAWALQHLGDCISALGAYNAFLTAYPESPEAPHALIQRAYLEQKQGDLKSALGDYNHFLEKYPHAPESELVLHQKAWIQGAQQDRGAMITTLEQLLASYPKSIYAAEANYSIGSTFFEEKNYQKAIPFLEKAKNLDPKKFSEKAGLRLLVAHYNLGESELALRDATKLPLNIIPLEISSSLGLVAYQQGNLDQAEQFLNSVVASNDPHFMNRDVLIALAEIFIKKGKYQAAKIPTGKALDLSNDPASRAAALLMLAKIEQGLGNFSKSELLAREAMLLQPEGSINQESRSFINSLLNHDPKK